MNKQKQIIFSLATAISLSASTAALADDVQTVLDHKDGTKTEHSLNNVMLKRIESPQTIQDHVINFQLNYQQRHGNKTNEIATTVEPVESGWRQHLGNPVKI